MKNMTEHASISEFNAQLNQWIISQGTDKSNLLSMQCYNISIGGENTCIARDSSMGKYVIEYINIDIAKNGVTQSEQQYYDILKAPIIAILVGTSFIYGGLSISLVVSSLYV
ncbi:MAG: hypothetical protein HRU36_04080 [Rickettsiales bacterium]|nr:hypothetical protein [Rickettsiales bacterium]